MRTPLEILESPIIARVGEGVNWELDTSPYGGSPTDMTVEVVNGLGVDVTATTMSNTSPTAFGNLIYLPTFQPMTKGTYVLTIQFSNMHFAPARPFVRIEVEP